MTPETIKAIVANHFNAHFGNRICANRRDKYWLEYLFADIFTAFLSSGPPTTRDTFDAEHQEPAARPDSAGEGRKDRAGEMASRVVDWNGTGNHPWLQKWIADALRAYGDELLEGAAREIEQQSYDSQDGRNAADLAQHLARSLKSTAKRETR